MPVHKFITKQQKSNILQLGLTKVIPHTTLEHPPIRDGNKIIVYAQKDMKMTCDPKMLALGIGANITQKSLTISLPQELRYRRLGLINSVIAESCDDIIVSVGVFPDTNTQSTRNLNVLIQKGTPLCILML